MFLDYDFLKRLMENKERSIKAKVIALDIDELPVETIEGRVTSGSINLDGNSSVRRTCQLSLVAETTDFNAYTWSLNTKFKLQIGLQNNIDKRYPDIIWFNFGIYLISSFSQALSTTNFSINISGKDKMCLLNGEVGGSLTAQTDFGKYEEIDANGNRKLISYPLKDVVREAVHQYAGEPFHNIIVDDLDEPALILQEYKYNTPMYLLRYADQSEYIQATLNGDMQIKINDISTTLNNLDDDEFDYLFDLIISDQSPTKFKIGDKDQEWCAAKIKYGETAGYVETELTYNGELIGNVGESITSIFDKIKNMLGNYEYFYDVEGRFIFQKKKNYLETSWSPIQKSEDNVRFVNPLETASNVVYEFNNNELFTAFNNTPNVGGMKNDYSVWGSRTGNGGADIPIHMRYAIDQKPIAYRSIQVNDDELIEYNKQHNLQVIGQDSRLYATQILNNYEYNEQNQTLTLMLPSDYISPALFINDKYFKNYDKNSYTLTLNLSEQEEFVLCDWREIIYQMALDYRKYNHLSDFSLRVAKANPELFPTGKTGYEQYYIDLEGFWRQLYNQEETYKKISVPSKDELSSYYIENITEEKLDYRNIPNGTKVYLKVKDGDYRRVVAPYSEDIQYYSLNTSYIQASEPFNENTQYYKKSNEYYGEGEPYAYWHKNLVEAPNLLNFWFDFLDNQGELEQFSVYNVGNRPKVVNDKDVKSIYYKETPNLIFVEGAMPVVQKTGYKYFNIGNHPAYKGIFSTSAQSKTAKAAIDELLYQHAYCVESVSITSIPVYNLDVNSRIHITDKDSGIDDDYIIDKISLPLNYGGTMNISAIKIVNRLF